MNEKVLAQLFAEFKVANSQALALVTEAVCKQLDAQKLQADITLSLRALTGQRGVSTLAVQAVQEVLTLVQAQALLQANQSGGAPHPK